jgi:anti-anti-sigma regulatory factor
LKITTDEGPKEIALKLEGRLAGPWVPEFRQAWKSLAGTLADKKFVVDLRGVTHVDIAGRASLAEVHTQAGAQFLADTPMTKYFAEEACRPGGDGKNSRRVE